MWGYGEYLAGSLGNHGGSAEGAVPILQQRTLHLSSSTFHGFMSDDSRSMSDVAPPHVYKKTVRHKTLTLSSSGSRAMTVSTAPSPGATARFRIPRTTVSPPPSAAS